MSLFSWLFGAKSSFPVKHPLALPSEIVMEPSAFGTNFIEIRSRKFFGQCSRSPNNRYTLAWRDANHAGADPTSEFGRYLLIDGSTVVADGKMARPNDGHVADNGNFVLNDWGDRHSLSCTVWAFQANGKRILSRTFTANLFNNALSADGALAVCQTCNSNSTDSSLLTVFDLVKGAEIASWHPESGWAQTYGFLDGGQIIQLGYRDMGPFSYSVNGEFIDREKWIDAELAKGSLFMVERLLKETSGAPSTDLAERLIQGIDRGLAAANVDDARTKAWGLKMRGACLEAQGSLFLALECYERALALYPKIGAKRCADQLRKFLAKTG